MPSAAWPKRSGRLAQFPRRARTSAVPYRPRRRSGCCVRSDTAWRAASYAAPTASSRSPGDPCRRGNRRACRSPTLRRARAARSNPRARIAETRARPGHAPAEGREGRARRRRSRPWLAARQGQAGRSSAAIAARSGRLRGEAFRVEARPRPGHRRAARAPGRHLRWRPTANSAAPPMRSAAGCRPTLSRCNRESPPHRRIQETRPAQWLLRRPAAHPRRRAGQLPAARRARGTTAPAQPPRPRARPVRRRQSQSLRLAWGRSTGRLDGLDDPEHDLFDLASVDLGRRR